MKTPTQRVCLANILRDRPAKRKSRERLLDAKNLVLLDQRKKAIFQGCPALISGSRQNSWFSYRKYKNALRKTLKQGGISRNSCGYAPINTRKPQL